MGTEYENTWPKCGCSERCAKAKCRDSGGRALGKVSLESLGISDVGKKNSPARMKLFLDKLTEWPNVTKAALISGVTYSSIKYWLKKSATGQPGDGFDLEYAEERKRFHEHYADALEGGIQQVEDAYVERAMLGYYETLHHQGQVKYQIDDDLVALGETGPSAYLRDENGKPIPERIHHQDPEVMLAVLKAWKRDRYGQHDTLDVLHKGGVMVVTAPARTSAELEAREKREMGAPVDVEFIEVIPEADEVSK